MSIIPLKTPSRIDFSKISNTFDTDFSRNDTEKNDSIQIKSNTENKSKFSNVDFLRKIKKYESEESGYLNKIQGNLENNNNKNFDNVTSSLEFKNLSEKNNKNLTNNYSILSRNLQKKNNEDNEKSNEIKFLEKSLNAKTKSIKLENILNKKEKSILKENEINSNNDSKNNFLPFTNKNISNKKILYNLNLNNNNKTPTKLFRPNDENNEEKMTNKSFIGSTENNKNDPIKKIFNFENSIKNKGELNEIIPNFSKSFIKNYEHESNLKKILKQKIKIVTNDKDKISKTENIKGFSASGNESPPPQKKLSPLLKNYKKKNTEDNSKDNNNNNNKEIKNEINKNFSLKQKINKSDKFLTEENETNYINNESLKENKNISGENINNPKLEVSNNNKENSFKILNNFKESNKIKNEQENNNTKSEDNTDSEIYPKENNKFIIDPKNMTLKKSISSFDSIQKHELDESIEINENEFSNLNNLIKKNNRSSELEKSKSPESSHKGGNIKLDGKISIMDLSIKKQLSIDKKIDEDANINIYDIIKELHSKNTEKKQDEISTKEMGNNDDDCFKKDIPEEKENLERKNIIYKITRVSSTNKFKNLLVFWNKNQTNLIKINYLILSNSTEKFLKNQVLIKILVYSNENKTTKEENINFSEHVKSNKNFDGEITLKEIKDYFNSIKGKIKT